MRLRRVSFRVAGLSKRGSACEGTANINDGSSTIPLLSAWTRVPRKRSARRILSRARPHSYMPTGPPRDPPQAPPRIVVATDLLGCLSRPLGLVSKRQGGEPVLLEGQPYWWSPGGASGLGGRRFPSQCVSVRRGLAMQGTSRGTEMLRYSPGPC